MTARLLAFILLGAACLASSLIFTMPAAAQGQPIIMPGACGGGGYHPVCARSRKKTLVTYVNDCAARNDGARVIGQGACPTACPMIFKPVCAVDGTGKRKTYGNECQAKAAGAAIVRQMRCVPLVR